MSEEALKKLKWCVQNGETADAKAIIDGGVAVDEPLGGRQALVVAADQGHLETVKMLVGAKADLNKTDEHGITATLAAIWEGHVDVVKFLKEQGADLTLKFNDASYKILRVEIRSLQYNDGCHRLVFPGLVQSQEVLVDQADPLGPARRARLFLLRHDLQLRRHEI